MILTYNNDALYVSLKIDIQKPTILDVGLFFGKVKLLPGIWVNPIEIDGICKLANEITPLEIDGNVKLIKDDLSTLLFNDVEVIVPTTTDNDKPQFPLPHETYESNKYGHSEIYGKGTLAKYDYLDPEKDITGHVFLGYTRYNKYILDGICTLLNQNLVEEIDCSVTLASDIIEEDLFEIIFKVPRYEINVFIDTTVIVPKYRVQYTFPVDIEVVLGSCTCFPVDLEVVNDFMWDILDGTTTIEKSYIDPEDMDCTITLLPEVYDDIECNVKLNNLTTYREMSGFGFLIGRVIEDFDIDIDTEAYEAPIYEYEDNILDCMVHFGGKSLFDFDIKITTNPAEKIEEDLIDGLVHLRDLKRIGIVVDPRWAYDPYVFKSSILTLFDKYHAKTILDIVYGGNPRSDWDIEHLGYVFKNYLTKSPIIIDPINPERTKRSIEHYIYHLSDKPVTKVFLFTDRPDYIASNPLSLITQFCKDNDIDFAIITSGGEFIDYHDNQAFSTTNNPLRTDPHSVLGPLSVMPMDHFNRVADPSDPKHPYYHPTKIIY